MMSLYSLRLIFFLIIVCNYYPLCYCGCPVLREERIKKHGHAVCGYQQDDKIFEQRILDYCWRIINNKNIKIE